jgi:hypothetical protein
MQLVELASKRVIATVHARPDEIASVVLDADGSRAASGNQLWDLASARPILKLPTSCTAYAFVANGSRLFTTCGRDGAALWDVHPETRTPAEIDRLIAERLPFELRGAAIVKR